MLYFFICLLVLFTGCARNSPMQTTAISDQTGINMLNIRKGMQSNEVLSIMGSPYKYESKSLDEVTYSIWYYISTPTVLGQGELLPYNFTPFIFQDNILLGWGTHFYKYTFNIDNERDRIDQEKSQKYTNDANEWPKNDHTLIPPPEEKLPPSPPPPPPPPAEKHHWWE